MIVRLFKNTYPAQIAIIILTMVTLWIPAFLKPVEPNLTLNNLQPFYNLLIRSNIFSNTIINTIIAIVIILFEAFFLNKIVNKFNIISKTTCFPALLYVLLMSLHPAGLTIHPTLFSNLFLIFIIYNLFNSNEEQSGFQSVVGMGMYLSVASMIYFPIIFLLPILILLIPVIDNRRAKVELIFLGGVILPYYLLAFSYFMTDTLQEMSQHYLNIFDAFLNFPSENHTFEYITVGILSMILIIAIAKLLMSIFEMVIATRRKIIFLMFMTIGLIAGISFSTDPFIDGIAAVVPVATIIIGKYIAELKRKKTADIFLLLLIAIIIIFKVVLYA